MGLVYVIVWLLACLGTMVFVTDFASAMRALELAALPIVLTALFWLAAAGWGGLIQRLGRTSLPRHVTAVMTLVGGVTLLMVSWVAAMGFGQLELGQTGPAVWLGLIGVGVAMWGWQLFAQRRRVGYRVKSLVKTKTALNGTTLLLTLLSAVPMGLFLIAVTVPLGTLWSVEAFGYDVLSYHLQLPREWAAAELVQEPVHNVYGYFPSLMEVGYLFVAESGHDLSSNKIQTSVIRANVFHASWLWIAAWVMAESLQRLGVGKGYGVLAFVLLPAVPWVLVVGTLAYNELGVLAVGAGAVGVVLRSDFQQTSRSGPWAMAVMAGLLLGGGVMFKLSAGPMLAVPVGVMLGVVAIGQWRERRWSMVQAVAVPGACVLVALLVVMPYLVRNTVWTGNPVFPFATAVFGAGDWSAAQVARWQAAHHLSEEVGIGDRLSALDRQWLRNAGYGALGGESASRSATEMARFSKEGGVPVLMLAAGFALVLLLNDGRLRGVALLLGLMVLVQVVAWLSVTHLQSRFLVPTLVPLVMLVGLGMGCLHQLTKSLAGWLAPTLIACLAFALNAGGVMMLWQQTVPITLESGERVRAPLAWLVGSDDLISPHPINALPAASKTLIVADNQGLYRIDRPMVYASAFDRNPLADLMGQPRDQVVAALREHGFTHLYVGYSEMQRLHDSYGFDEALTVESMRELVEGWPVVSRVGGSVLVAIPEDSE